MEKNNIGTLLKKSAATAVAVFCTACLCAVPASAKTFNLFLLTGQSNSLGAIKGNAADPKNMKPKPKMLFWHGNFGSYCTGGDSTKWEPVAPQKESQVVMGPEYGFARGLERGAAKKRGLKPEECGILKVSRDGGGNSLWVAPDGEAYKKILATAEKALAALPSRGYDAVEVRALLYLQGESNQPAEIAVAGTRLAELRQNLAKDLAALNVRGIKKISTGKMALLVGEPANWKGKDNKAPNGSTTPENLKKMTETEPRAAWIQTRDQPKIKTGDNLGVHYDGNAQLVIGQRFADAYAALAD